MAELSDKTHEYREVHGLKALLDFGRGKEIAEDLPRATVSHEYGKGGGVLFTDGTALVVIAVERGFPGSDVTPPDPAEVAYFTVVPKPIDAK